MNQHTAYPVFLTISHPQPKPSGIQLKRFEPNATCDQRWFTFGSLQLRTPRAVSTTRLVGTVELRQNLGRNVTIVSKLRRAGSFVFSLEKMDACSFVASQYKSWSLRLQPLRGGCPIQRGRYNVLNLTIAEKMFDMNGEYRLEVNVIRNNVDLCGAVVHFSVHNSDSNTLS